MGAVRGIGRPWQRLRERGELKDNECDKRAINRPHGIWVVDGWGRALCCAVQQAADTTPPICFAGVGGAGFGWP